MGLNSEAYRLDPALWVKDRLGLSLDPWQTEVMRSTSPRILLNCSRQSGKSTVSAALALWTAIYRPGSLILCLSPTLRQSSELFHIVSTFYGLAPDVPSKSESVLRIDLTNASRIISLPGQEGNIRGYAANLIVVDESAKVHDDLYFSARPMLAVSGGRLVALSTPFGTRGWWYESWRSKELWERFEIPASECPRISPEFLAEERRVLGSYWYQQEYECSFLDSSNQVFRREDVDAMFSEDTEHWDL